MKKLASILLAGTMISGAALSVSSAAWADSNASFILAQAELVPPPAGEAPDGKQKKRPAGPAGEEKQQRKQERPEQKQPREAPVEKTAPVEKQAPIERQAPEKLAPPPVEKAAPPAPVEKLAPPPVEKQAPPPPPVEKQAPVEKLAPPVEKPAPAPVQTPDAVTPPPVEKTAPPAKSDTPTPPVPPVPPRTESPVAPSAPPAVEPSVPPDAVAPPAPNAPPVPGAQPPVPGAPPAAGSTKPGKEPAPQAAPEAPSVAPAPPPAGEKPAIPPEELKGGQRTPEQRERAKERSDADFRTRDKGLDAKFDRKVEQRGDRTIIREGDNRVIVRDGDRTIIRSDENERLGRNARDVRQEKRGNQTITVIQRPDGSEIVTIKDQDGNLIRRVRREGGREVVIIDNERAWERGGRWDNKNGWNDRDQGLHINFYLDLAPVRVAIPREEYIVDSDHATYEQYEEALVAPPLVQTERPYSLQEVTQNIRLRERVRSIDLNSITFPTGAWTVPDDQVPKLEDLAKALKAAIDRDPSQVYLIEGHTDAVGSAVDNLSLSDRRAEEVAAILTAYYQIPAENLVTQGYGEDYLKVNTISANEDNRRVTIRNITSLLGTQQSQAAPQ